MKICIGVPTNRSVKAKTAQSLLELVARGGHEFCFVFATEGYTVAENRNYIVVQALNAKCDWLLFVDDDMTFPPDTLERLLAHGKRIIGVASHSRLLPVKYTVELLEGSAELPNELFEARAVGCGVMLVDTSIFRELNRPWFGFKTFDTGQIARGEDAWFCDLARDNGYKVWCDPTIPIGHIGDYSY